MNYTFTYTDTKYALKLLSLSFGSFILFMILLLNFPKIITQYLGHYLYAAISILTPLTIFFLFKKKIGRSGEAEVRNGVLHFNLDSKKQDIKIENIESYKVEYNQGIVFRIKTRHGKKLKITANHNSSNPSTLEAFVSYFETIISNYNSNHKPIPREKSSYEKKGMFYFLLLSSVLLAVGIPYMLFKGVKIPGAVYIGFGSIMVAWYDYFKTKRKFKRTYD